MCLLTPVGVNTQSSGCLERTETSIITQMELWFGRVNSNGDLLNQLGSHRFDSQQKFVYLPRTGITNESRVKY